MRLADRVAIITGASSGIGRTSARLFAKEGAKLVVADIDDSGGEETVTAIKSDGGEAIFVHTDVSIASEVEHLIKVTMDRYVKIDILYNSAGIFMESTPVESVKESLWDRIFEVNIKGTFLTAKYVVPEMKKAGGGVIINTGSMLAVRTSKYSSPYSSSKGAVIALTRTLALELAPYNIRVNCINPALTETPMIKVIPEERKQALVNSIPLGRIVKPEDIAHAALYLASDESSMLTGSSLNVDGGRDI